MTWKKSHNRRISLDEQRNFLDEQIIPLFLDLLIHHSLDEQIIIIFPLWCEKESSVWKPLEWALWEGEIFQLCTWKSNGISMKQHRLPSVLAELSQKPHSCQEQGFCIRPFISPLVDASRIRTSWLIPATPINLISPRLPKEQLALSSLLSVQPEVCGLFFGSKSHCGSELMPVSLAGFSLKRALLKSNVLWLPRGVKDTEQQDSFTTRKVRCTCSNILLSTGAALLQGNQECLKTLSLPVWCVRRLRTQTWAKKHPSSLLLWV